MQASASNFLWLPARHPICSKRGALTQVFYETPTSATDPGSFEATRQTGALHTVMGERLLSCETTIPGGSVLTPKEYHSPHCSIGARNKRWTIHGSFLDDAFDKPTVIQLTMNSQWDRFQWILLIPIPSSSPATFLWTSLLYIWVYGNHV